jgi:N-acetyl sugar amidotransferase
MRKLEIPKEVKKLKTNSAGYYDVYHKIPINKEVEFCKKCVISNQRPRITFDEKGVCAPCNYAEIKHLKIDWAEREKMLQELLVQYRSKDGSYDCIVPVSGGKDSGFVAHQLKYKYNMHPLTCTFAPLRWTEIGWKNLKSLIDAGFDNQLFIPDTYAYRLLVRLSLEYMGDPFVPFIYGVKAFPIKLAVKYNIPLIFYGENGEIEYGGETRNLDKICHNISKDLRDHDFKGMMPSEWEKYGVNKDLLSPFSLPDPDEVEKKGIKCTWMSYFKKWIPQENYYYSAKNIGFEANPEGRSEGTYSKYASLDDKFDGFHYYFGFIKFGIGRATSDAAHEIRDRHLTREEGVALVKRYDGEFPKKNFKEFLEYIDVTEEYFWKIVDKFRNPWIWEKISGEWKLKHQIK